MKKLQSPLPIAEGRAIVQLSSGEYVCVDTHTLDSIPYLIGLELEPEIIRVFRTFITRRSVVLDIGANVGLYTALLSTAVRRYGRSSPLKATRRSLPRCNTRWAPTSCSLNRISSSPISWFPTNVGAGRCITQRKRRSAAR